MLLAENFVAVNTARAASLRSRRKVAVGLVDVGAVPTGLRVFVGFAAIVADDHDQDPMFAVETDRMSQLDRASFVNLRFQSLDHAENLSMNRAASNDG